MYAHSAQSCQILCRLIKALLRYGDLSIFFKMAAVRHLEFEDAYWTTQGLCRSFDNVKDWILFTIGLKAPI